MTFLALILVGVAASAGSAWALARGGTIARIGALGGVLALVLMAVLAAASPTPDSLTPDATGAVPGTLWNGALVPGAYLRLVVALWSTTSVLLAGLAWLLRGTGGLRGLLPASLAALVGTAVTLAAATPALGIVAGAATGLASVPVVLTTRRAAAVGIAAREVRNAVGTALVLLAVASVAPVVARLVLADPGGAGGGSGIVAAVSFGLLAMAVVVAARVGGIPYHVRVSALTDIVPAGSLPLVVAWLPLPITAVAVGVAVGVLAPLAAPVGPARTLILAATLAATLAACLVAFLQDDLRHAVGYLTIADLGLVVLAVAAVNQALWEPARTWLLSVAVTKTALGAWAAVVEDRFETRSVPELRGWLRPSPLLGVALAMIVVATYGVPGWAVMDARSHLIRYAADNPWATVLLVASFLTLPAYLRWLWVGVGSPTSHVGRSVPELARLAAGRLDAARLPVRGRPPLGRWRSATLPVEQETSDAAPGASAGTADGGEAGPAVSPSLSDVRPRSGMARRGRDAVGRSRAALGPGATTRAAGSARRHRTGLLSAVVLALALLASLVASGAFGITSAASEPVPAVAGIAIGG